MDYIRIADPAWRDFGPLACREAARAFRRFPLLRRLYEFEDVVSELALTWERCLRRHDPAKGKFSTLFCFSAQNSVLKLVDRVRRTSRAVAVEDWSTVRAAAPPQPVLDPDEWRSAPDGVLAAALGRRRYATAAQREWVAARAASLA